MNISFLKPGQIISIIPDAETDTLKITIRGRYDITGFISSDNYKCSDLQLSDLVVIAGNYKDFDSDNEGTLTGFSLCNVMINSRIPLESTYAVIRDLNESEELFW